MRRIRVFVVDRSVVVRHAIMGAFAADPDLEVAGMAVDGLSGLVEIPKVEPDLLVLDAQVPDMDGLEALTAIRKLYPKLPVIICSDASQCGAARTMEALSLGATDCVARPAEGGNPGDGYSWLRQHLIPKIKLYARGLSGVEAMWKKPSSAGIVRTGDRRCSSLIGRVNVVAIGTSTGGPNALAAVLGALPPDLPVPVVVVQHMPAVFTLRLAERLSAQSKLVVKEAAPGDVLRSGQVYIAPGDYHMTVKLHDDRAVIETNKEAHENFCRPAVDVLFRSVAGQYGSGALGVILTGMGHDGLKGCETIHAAGGQVLAQDEASSVVWGMPGMVARAGVADQVLPLTSMPGEILRRVRRGRSLVGSMGSVFS